MSTFTQSFGDAFRPHRRVSSSTLWLLGGAQLAIAMGLWLRAGTGVLPGPTEVIRALGDLWVDEGLGRELVASALTSLEAVALASAIALPLAWATVLPALRPLAALLAKGRFLGLMGLTFLFTLLTGGGHALKLALLTFGMGVFLVTGMAEAVASIPKEKLEHARTLGMSEWRVVFEVVVLGTAHQALELIRQNAAIGWTMVTLVEGLYRGEGGVGALLLNQNKHFHLAEVFAIQLCILLVGLAQDAALVAVRRGLCPYAELARERR
ncbi:MAG: ABC transporter permease subunit [Deltaproteobacteria bacterium]|nr:ABC transporter permease subunit [Deltaproteobacteria bacterium]